MTSFRRRVFNRAHISLQLCCGCGRNVIFCTNARVRFTFTVSSRSISPTSEYVHAFCICFQYESEKQNVCARCRKVRMKPAFPESTAAATAGSLFSSGRTFQQSPVAVKCKSVLLPFFFLVCQYTLKHIRPFAYAQTHILKPVSYNAETATYVFSLHKVFLFIEHRQHRRLSRHYVWFVGCELKMFFD